MSDLGLWTGLNQGVQNTIAMGMNLMQLQSQREHQRALEVAQTEHLKLAQEQAEREKITFQHAERKRVEQERIENSIVPASLIAPQIHDNPKFKNTAVDAARNAGFKVDILPDGEIYTTNKAYSYIGNLMKTNTEFQKIATDSLIEDLVGKSTTLAAKITEIQQSGKEDKTLPALQQQQLAVKKQIGEMLGASRSIMEKILVEQAKPVQQDTVPYMTPDGKTVLINERDPNSQMIINQQGLIPVATYNAKEPGKVPMTPREFIAPDGKTAQMKTYNPATKDWDIPVGQPYPVKSQVININTANKEAEGFNSWTPEAKNQAFMYNLITKEPPVSTRGMMAADRQAYAKGYSQWQVDKGFSPQDIALMQADYKAGNMSLANMAKQEAPMSAFVGNINKQIDKVKQLYDNNDRIGIRLLDKPVRDIKVLAKGSGDEAVKASYLLEISNEIGKLSSGASASVQQLSDSAKEDWKKVHDPNLSFKEIMKIVNATRDQANMRMQSWREAKQEVRNALGFIGTTNAPVTTGFDIDAITAELNRRKGK